jgi:sensor histidine kinase YesM
MFKSKNRYYFVLGLAVYSFLNARFTIGDRLFEFDPGDGVLFISISILVLALWEVNRWIESRWKFIIPRINHLITHFILSVIGVVLISLVVLTSLYYIIGAPVELNWVNLKLTAAFSFRVNLFLNTVNAVVYYIKKSKAVELENEVQQKLLLESQHQSLRNQINPHFLFNSLNALSSLIKKDIDQSEKFIDQLSRVYRYLLQHQETDVVTIKEEMRFINSYLYLLQTRFGQSLEISIDLDDSYQEKMIAPGVIQILVENAVKHNIASKKSPLKLSISVINETIVVSNNLQKKDAEKASTKIGLNNIIERYKFLSEESIGIVKTATEFTVSVPLLSMNA